MLSASSRNSPGPRWRRRCTSSGVFSTTAPMTPTCDAVDRERPSEVCTKSGGLHRCPRRRCWWRGTGSPPAPGERRRRSTPKSNSWLPKLVASRPHAFSTSIAGMSSSSAEFGGDAPTLSPDGEQQRLVPAGAPPPRRTSSPAGRRRRPATDWPLIVTVRRVELTVEVVEADDRQRPGSCRRRRAGRAARPALAVLRHRDVEQERRRRGEVDAAHVVDRSPVDGIAAGQERGPHVGVAVEVLDVGHVAVLAEERREGDERARRGGVELVRRRREHDEVAGAGRVRHVGRAVRAVGDGAGLGLGEGAVDDLPALRPRRRPVQSLGSVRARNAALIRATVAASSVAATCWNPPPAGIAAGEVEVDLDRSAGPARLGLADRLAGGGAAVRRLRPREQAEVDEHLAGVDGQELRREAVVGRHERREVVVAQAPLGQAHRGVGALVGAADERLALLDATVGRAVDLDVVVRRVVVAVRQVPRDEPEELVLELVGDRVADHRQVGLVGPHDVA